MRRLCLASAVTGLIAVTGLVASVPAPARASDGSADALESISGPITLASTTADGVKGNDSSFAADISSSGDAVAFESTATNFDARDTDFLVDVYVKNLATGELTLADTDDSGTKGDGSALRPSISGDGSAVAFESDSSNLDPGSTGRHDVYVKDVVTGDITLASTSDTGDTGVGVSDYPSISRAGTLVAFESTSDNLDPADTDVTNDVYVKDLATGDLTLASITRAGVKADAVSSGASLSSSGGRVAFTSDADNLNTKDTDTASDVYVKVLGSGKLILASTTAAGVKGNDSTTGASLSGGGTKVAFVSTATNLDPRDTLSDEDVYVKDLPTGELTLASTNDAGVKANGPSEFAALSPDGKRVAFTSNANNLDPADPTTDWDLYLKDLTTGDLSLVNTSSLGEKGDGGVHGLPSSVSGKGARVAFGSAAQLDPGDTDGVADVYVKDPIMCTILGTPGDDVLTGTRRDDVLCGRSGIDVIDGKGGDDVVFGEVEDDILIGGKGSDRLDGGAGTDTVDYSASDAAVTVDLSTSSGAGGDAEGDQLAGIDALVGSPFDDTLTGDDAGNFFVGGGGADVIDGGAGTDLANYFSSASGVTVNLDKAIVSGGDAAGDVLTAIENVSGSGFDDLLTGDDDANLLIGANGDDTLKGKGGNDTLQGQGGNDTFDGGGGTDSCDNGTGESATQCEP